MKKIYYQSGFKYQLTRNYVVQLDIKPVVDIHTEHLILRTDGILYIKHGYAWDGPSGPMVDTDTAMRGSLVHDALYQLIRLELLNQKFRKPADMEFKKICSEDHMFWFRSFYAFRGLQLARGIAALPSNRRKELVAP